MASFFDKQNAFSRQEVSADGLLRETMALLAQAKLLSRRAAQHLDQRQKNAIGIACVHLQQVIEELQGIVRHNSSSKPTFMEATRNV